MRRYLIPSIGCLLFAGLLLAAFADGHIRPGHEIARAGQAIQVGCGPEDGGRALRNHIAVPVESATAVCRRCGDCDGISDVDLPGMVAMPDKAIPGSRFPAGTAGWLLTSRLDLKRPRGPPIKAQI